jgi:hypothetical protein
MSNDAIKLAGLFAGIVAIGSTPILLSAATEYWLAHQWAFYCASHAAEPICVALF